MIKCDISYWPWTLVSLLWGLSFIQFLQNPYGLLNGDITHYRLNELPHIMYWKILISILGMSGYICDLDTPREKWLNYLQIGKTLIRRRILRCLWSGSVVFTNYLSRGLQTQLINIDFVWKQHLCIHSYMSYSPWETLKNRFLAITWGERGWPILVKAT